MLVASILASALLISSAGSVPDQKCDTKWGIRDTSFLIETLQEDPPSKCGCSTNVTSCLCLPIPSGDCATPCFQEGLSQMTNATRKARFWVVLNRVKRTVGGLKNSKCPMKKDENQKKKLQVGRGAAFLL